MLKVKEVELQLVINYLKSILERKPEKTEVVTSLSRFSQILEPLELEGGWGPPETERYHYTIKCLHCEKEFSPARRAVPGREQKYCSEACREENYRIMRGGRATSDVRAAHLLRLIQVVVLENRAGDWRDHRNKILEVASYTEQEALKEFANWFAE